MKINTGIIKMLIVLFCLSSCSKNRTTAINYIEKPKESTEIMKLLIGTYTNKTSEGIYTLDFNVNDGTLSNKVLVAQSESPSFLAKSKDGNYVYAVNENNDGEVSSFKWNADRTKLIAINKLSTQGVHPCFLELNKVNNLLAVANYSSGNAAVFSINTDGSLKENPQVSYFSYAFG